MLELLLQWYRRRFTDAAGHYVTGYLTGGFLHSLLLQRYFSAFAGRSCFGLFIRVANCPLAAYWLFTILGGQYRICAICQYHAVSGICRGTNGLAARD